MCDHDLRLYAANLSDKHFHRIARILLDPRLDKGVIGHCVKAYELEERFEMRQALQIGAGRAFALPPDGIASDIDDLDVIAALGIRRDNSGEHQYVVVAMRFDKHDVGLIVWLLPNDGFRLYLPFVISEQLRHGAAALQYRHADFRNAFLGEYGQKADHVGVFAGSDHLTRVVELLDERLLRNVAPFPVQRRHGILFGPLYAEPVARVERDRRGIRVVG